MKRLALLGSLAAALLSPVAAAAAPDLPVRRIVRHAVEPFAGGGAVPAYKLRSGDPKLAVAAADLSFDRAVSAGAGVRKILAEVGTDPYAAYRWVRDKVEYLPYFGVKAGAEGVAWSQVGNDFDQAALLAALLRSQDVPARFVYGVVRVEAKVLADWFGMASAEEAFLLLVQGGVPVRSIQVSGIIKYVEMSHCWLEARIPIANPGNQGPGESVWIPLDPSFKRHEVTRGQDLFLQLDFQQENFLRDYLNLTEESSPEEYFRDLLRQKLADYGNVSTLADVATRVSVIAQGDGSLPTAMPPELNVLGVIWEEALIPEVYHYRIRLTLWDGHGDGGGVTTGDIRVTIPSAFFSEHALTVSYVPATAEDQALADGTASGSSLDVAVRNEIRLRPELRVDGKPVTDFFSGDFLEAGIPGMELPDQSIPANIGYHQKLLVETLAPATDPADTLPLHMGAVERELQVGGVYALGCTGGLISAARVGTAATALNELRQSGTTEQILSASLSLAALQYEHKRGLSAAAIASFLGVRHFEEPVLMLCGIHPTGGLDPGGVYFDVCTFVMALVSRDGRENRERAFMFLTGMQSSYHEHEVLSDVFQTTAVSAVRILRHVQGLGASPLFLDGDSPDLAQTLTGLIGLSGDQKEEILEHVMGEGWKLIIPTQRVTLERWSGWGYIVWDPDSGSGGYMISGGLAGGNMSGKAKEFVVQLFKGYMGAFTVIHWSYQDADTKQWVGGIVYASDNTPFIAWTAILPVDHPPKPFDKPESEWPSIDFTLQNPQPWQTLPDTYYINGSRTFRVIGYCWLPSSPNALQPLVLSQGLVGGIDVRSIKWKVGSNGEWETKNTREFVPAESFMLGSLTVRVVERQHYSSSTEEITHQASATMRRATPSSTYSTLTAERPYIWADNVDYSTITVTLKDEYSQPLSAWTVSFSGNFAPGSVTSGTTDAAGSCATNFHTAVPGTYSIAATAQWGTMKPFAAEPVALTALHKGLVALVPDYNRDGQIDDEDTLVAAAGTPFRFWINDNDDYGDADGMDTPGNGDDGNNYYVDSVRDLTDFFPLMIDIQESLERYFPSDRYDYVLMHDGSLRAIGTNSTASEELVQLGPFEAQAHLSDPQVADSCALKPTYAIPNTGLILSGAFLETVLSANAGVILLEGSRASDAPLRLGIREKGSTAMGPTWSLPLSIKSSEEMYRYANLRTDGTGRQTKVGSPGNNPDDPSVNRNVFFIHGNNTDDDGARGWIAAMFKRLYWSGLKARFWGVSWSSNEGSATNYQQHVYRAFDTAKKLADFIRGQSLSGEKVIIAQSLGNMVASAAIQDYGLVANKYFLVDGAIAEEAFNKNAYNRNVNQDLNKMVPNSWEGYDQSTWASQWHEYFKQLTPSDDRSLLTWQDRFVDVPTRTSLYHLYSNTDQVFDIYDGLLDDPWLLSGLTDLLYRYSWQKQELLKGTRASLGGTIEAGWGRQNSYPSLQDANNATPQQLMQNPVFIHYPAEIFRYGSPGEVNDLLTRLRIDELIAKGIPASSYAAGREPMSLSGVVELNMNDLKPNGWGRGDDWLHNDLREMSYLYTRGVFRLIANEINE